MPAGRPRKPTALKRLQGNPGKRALPQDEPEFERLDEAANPPEWLAVEAKAEWRRLAAELTALGLLTDVSAQVFAGYCQAYARWREAEEWMQEHGRTIVMRDRDGRVTGVREVPQSKIATTEREQMRRLAGEFGLTPSEASKVKAQPKKTKSELAKIFEMPA